jgi:hypothetical protein
MEEPVPHCRTSRTLRDLQPGGTSRITTRAVRTERSNSAHPRAALPHAQLRQSGRYDETDSAASCTSMCRRNDVNGFSAPIHSAAPGTDEAVAPAITAPLSGSL